MLVDLACALASVLLLCCAAATRPRVAWCPPDWYVNGVRPSGLYECRRAPGGEPLYDGAAGYPDRTVDRPGWLVGRIYCTGGSRPVVVTERVVGCQR